MTPEEAIFGKRYVLLLYNEDQHYSHECLRVKNENGNIKIDTVNIYKTGEENGPTIFDESDKNIELTIKDDERGFKIRKEYISKYLLYYITPEGNILYKHPNLANDSDDLNKAISKNNFYEYKCLYEDDMYRYYSNKGIYLYPIEIIDDDVYTLEGELFLNILIKNEIKQIEKYIHLFKNITDEKKSKMIDKLKNLEQKLCNDNEVRNN